MTVAELIEHLKTFHPDTPVVLEMDDDYYHIAQIDSAQLVDPAAKNPVWDFETEDAPLNAVRICA